MRLTYSEALVLSEALSQYLENSDPENAIDEPTETQQAMLADAERLLLVADSVLAGITSEHLKGGESLGR